MKIGAKVVLKSGGPVMTVVGVERDAKSEDDRAIWVKFWDVDTHKMESHSFPQAALDPAQEAPREDWSKAS